MEILLFFEFLKLFSLWPSPRKKETRVRSFYNVFFRKKKFSGGNELANNETKEAASFESITQETVVT